tara:strand:- start:1562 stop:1822 length:261 start_codon:yes stop_codon:yes gene_type:complete
MKPLKLDPKEIDIIVSCLEQALIFWEINIEDERLPEGFDTETAEKLYEEIICTYIKISNLQKDMEKDISLEDSPLPDNVLKFPSTN